MHNLKFVHLNLTDIIIHIIFFLNVVNLTTKNKNNKNTNIHNHRIEKEGSELALNIPRRNVSLKP